MTLQLEDAPRELKIVLANAPLKKNSRLEILDKILEIIKSEELLVVVLLKSLAECNTLKQKIQTDCEVFTVKTTTSQGIIANLCVLEAIEQQKEHAPKIILTT